MPNENTRVLTIETNARFEDIQALYNSPQISEILNSNQKEGLVKFNTLRDPLSIEVSDGPEPEDLLFKIESRAGEGSKLTIVLSQDESFDPAKPKFNGALESINQLKGSHELKFDVKGVTEDVEASKTELKRRLARLSLDPLTPTAGSSEEYQSESEYDSDEEDEDRNFVVRFFIRAKNRFVAALKSIRDSFSDFFASVKNYLFPATDTASAQAAQPAPVVPPAIPPQLVPPAKVAVAELTIQEECDNLVKEAKPGQDLTFPKAKQLAYEQEYNQLQAQKKSLQSQGHSTTEVSEKITACNKAYNQAVRDYVTAFTKAIEEHGKGKHLKNDGFCAEQKQLVGAVNNNCGANALLHIIMQNLTHLKLTDQNHVPLISDLFSALNATPDTSETIDLKKIQMQYAALTQSEQEKLLGPVVRRHIARTLGTSNDFYTTWRTNTLVTLVADSLMGESSFDPAVDRGSFQNRSAVLNLDGKLNPDKVEPGVFYLSKDGHYVVRDSAGKVREGRFNLITDENKLNIGIDGKVVKLDEIKPDQIYFTSDFNFAFLKNDQKTERGILPSINLDELSKLSDSEFDKKLKDSEFQDSILSLTSKLGHTSTPFLCDAYAQYLALEVKGRICDDKNTSRPREDITAQENFAQAIFKRRFEIYADEHNMMMTSEPELEAYAQIMGFKLDFYDYSDNVGYNRRVKSSNLTAAFEGAAVDNREPLFHGAIFNRGMHWEYVRDVALPLPEATPSSGPSTTPKLG